VRPLRFDGETDAQFRRRAERAGHIARLLVDAALANRNLQAFIDDPKLPYSVDSVRRSPTVRIEYEQAIAIGDLGSCLAATRSKHWGDGPYVLPLKPDDPVDPYRVIYIYRENSLYNRRFEQRMRLKELLGRNNRPLVETAKRRTKSLFLGQLTEHEGDSIRRILGIEPGEFWQAVQGRRFLDLPPRMVQLELQFYE
jgi:hypothetical protein